MSKDNLTRVLGSWEGYRIGTAERFEAGVRGERAEVWIELRLATDRPGDTKQVTLMLPRVVKKRIHEVIRTNLRTRGLVAGSLIVGFLISLLESLCTGQVCTYLRLCL